MIKKEKEILTDAVSTIMLGNKKREEIEQTLNNLVLQVKCNMLLEEQTRLLKKMSEEQQRSKNLPL